MEIWEKILGDIYVIGISGRMDTINSKDIEAKLDSLINHDRAKIIIDLAEVDYISSVGLRSTAGSSQEAKRETRNYKTRFFTALC